MRKALLEKEKSIIQEILHPTIIEKQMSKAYKLNELLIKSENIFSKIEEKVISASSKLTKIDEENALLEQQLEKLEKIKLNFDMSYLGESDYLIIKAGTTENLFQLQKETEKYPIKIFSKEIDIMGKKSKTLILVAVLVVATLSAYLMLTYPREIVSIPISFTLGAEVEQREFDVPILHTRVQVEVVVSSGTSLWNARIENQNGLLWNHTAAQWGQTTYTSGWIELSHGSYNFTFTTIGFGSLEAEIRADSKGGFF